MVKCILALTIVGSMPHGTTQAFTELPMRSYKYYSAKSECKTISTIYF